MAQKIKKGDEVVLLAGKDKGRNGQVKKVLPKENKCIIQGINIVKRHQKPTQLNPQGGIITKELPVHISNVSLIDPETKKTTRVGFMTTDKGVKVRFAKKSGKAIDV